jgi:osmoprotectant transport system permease protein
LVLVGGLVLWMTEPFAVRRDTVGGGVVEEGPRRQLVVGSKTFAESFTLAELMHRRLDPHFDVDHRTGLGSAVAFQALAAGELDAYVDYTGTLWTNVLGHDHLPPPGTMIYPMASELAARHGITVLGPLGFENAYAFAVRPELAQRLNATTISELAPHTDQLSIGSDPEFFGRPEWPALQQTYGLAFANERGMQSVLMYPAAAEGEVDVITAYTTDGGIARYGLTVLPDNEQALPPYDAVILLSSEAAEDPRVLAALRPLIHAMDLAMMQRANAMVDLEGGTPTEAAAWLDEQLLDAATGSSPP